MQSSQNAFSQAGNETSGISACVLGLRSSTLLNEPKP